MPSYAWRVLGGRGGQGRGGREGRREGVEKGGTGGVAREGGTGAHYWHSDGATGGSRSLGTCGAACVRVRGWAGMVAVRCVGARRMFAKDLEGRSRRGSCGSLPVVLWKLETCL